MANSWRPGEDLTPREREMVDAAAFGEVSGDLADEPYALDEMRAWGPERTVRAEVLRHLLLADEWPLDPGGVFLIGTKIAGELDLSQAQLRAAVSLRQCLVDGAEVLLAHATASRIAVIECHLPGIGGDGLRATAGLAVRRSTVTGCVRLLNACLDETLDFAGTTITGRNEYGYALGADGITVRGSVFLDEGFSAAGAVRLLGADVSLSIFAAGCTVTAADDGGVALQGDGCMVGGSLLLQSARLAGAAWFPGARIGAQLVLSGAELAAADPDGDSLFLAHVTVGGDALLAGGFTAVGAVELPGARIGGSLVVEDATLRGDRAFGARGARVEQVFHWRPAAPVTGAATLERMVVGRLADDWSAPFAHWPRGGKLRLPGLSYDGFTGPHPGSVRDRLAWIRAQYADGVAFSAQPYEQLVRVYRETGQDTDARTVAVAKHDDLRRYGELTWRRKLSNWLLGVTIRHGYAPLRAVLFLALVYAAVLVAFWHAQHRPGVVVAARGGPTAPAAADAAEHCRPGYPCFYPALHALDVVVPILDVRDADAWRADTRAPWGWAYVAGTVVGTAFGWAFSTLAVLGYTGMVRRE